MIKIAVLGYGTIGSGVVEVLETNFDVIKKRVGDGIEVKYVLDLRDFPGDPIQDRITHDYEDILKDEEVSIVVEAMGGVEPANTFARKAIESGKHFCTSNKALIAEHGAELIAMANAKGLSVLFEASVGGGIPIIRPLNTCITGDVVEEITGILNGTTNFMMTEMTQNGSDFDDVLKVAQAKGYAEADPTADIEGYDPCRKIAILTSLVLGKQVDFEKIHTEGITGISATDIRYAKKLGRAIKLLATSRKTEAGYLAMVAPFMLAPSHPLYNVNDVFNAVFVHGNMLGDAMFYGAGAGKLPTASAVVGDIVDIAKNLDKAIKVDWEVEEVQMADYKALSCRYFVRAAADKAAVEAAFGAVEYVEPEGDEIAFVTGELDGAAYEAAAAKIDVINRVRIDG